MVVKKGKGKKSKHVTHNTIAHELLADAGPVSEARLAPLPCDCASLYTGHGVLRCGISLWPAQVACPSYAPSYWGILFFWWTSSMAEWEGQGKKKKKLDLLWTGLIKPKNIRVFGYHSVSKTQHWEKINSIPAETRTAIKKISHFAL